MRDLWGIREGQLLDRTAQNPVCWSASRLERSMLVIWALVLLSHAPTVWLAGRDAMPFWTLAMVLVQAALMLLILARAWGVRHAMLALAGISALGWAAELTGFLTGAPFGRYCYTEVLQPQMAGVPLVVVLGWFAMLPPAWAVAGLISRSGHSVTTCVMSGVALTAWDLFVDPQAVQWGWWVWMEPESYFAVPLTNYAGWIVVGALLTAVVRPKPLPAAPLLLVYGGIWLTCSLGLSCLHGLTQAATLGCMGMGTMLVAACFRSSSRHASFRWAALVRTPWKPDQARRCPTAAAGADCPAHSVVRYRRGCAVAHQLDRASPVELR